MIGRTSVDNVVLATGHYRNGVLLTPVTADLVTDIVTGAQPDDSLRELVAPTRFAAATA
jgi:glycine oxidase